MRIDAKDRRVMNRRLKNRLPQAVQAGLQKVPHLALVLYTTLSLTPSAHAQMMQGTAVPEVVEISATKEGESRVYTKTYSKKDLALKVPSNPNVTLGERVGAEVNKLMRQLTRNQRGSAKRTDLDALETKVVTFNDYYMRLGAFKDAAETREANVDGVITYFNGELQVAATNRIRSEFKPLAEFQKGLSFDLNMTEVFTDIMNPSTPSASQSGTLQYGLVLQDIVHDPDAPRQAALNADEDPLRYAGQASVKWTIGPIKERKNRKLFSVNTAALKREEPSLWDRIKLPKLAFKNRITPESLTDISKLGSGGAPGVRVEISQVEGYYHVIHRTAAADGVTPTEHTVKVPIAGTMAVGRRFNEKFDVMQTSAYNILIDKRLPLVSVHHLNIEERYVADMTYNISGHRIGVQAKTEAKGTVAAEDRPKKYTLTYNKRI